MTRGPSIAGIVVGRLTVIEPTERRVARQVIWRCRCSCGNEAFVSRGNLKDSIVRSCGCLNSESASRRFTKHGDANRRREYYIWKGMRKRCLNPATRKWPRYGGRGISICAAWDDFAQFIADMGPCPPGHGIDRIDNDGNYEPSNCRWATNGEQARNRSTTRMFTIAGETLCLKDWASRFAVNYISVLKRLARGLTIKEALEPHAIAPMPSVSRRQPSS